MGEVGVCGIVPMEASLCPRHSNRGMSTVLGDTWGAETPTSGAQGRGLSWRWEVVTIGLEIGIDTEGVRERVQDREGEGSHRQLTYREFAHTHVCMCACFPPGHNHRQ